jgi:ubiquinone biosynthesis protein
MLNTARKLQRTKKIISVLAKYGFEDLLSRLPWKLKIKKIPEDENNLSLKNEENVYSRIRMVLEELGPAFVKLGQAATTREGLLPEELVFELKKLEDRVEPLEIDIEALLENELSIKIADHFIQIEPKPFASASISQVYKATLINGEDVVIKIRRPEVDEVLLADLALMKDISSILAHYSDTVERMNLPLIVDSFAITLEEELSLNTERFNITRFAKNFKENQNIYIPKVYPELSNNVVLCLEFIKGIKITEIDKLKGKGFDMANLVDKGLNLYLEQILVHGFFHGDPHPGNLLVMDDGRISFIDFGNMGKLLPIDKTQLEDFVQASVSQDAKRLGEIIEDMAIVAKINNRNSYERTLNEMFEIMNNVSLGDMDVQLVFSKIWKISEENQIYFPEYIYQLIRGVSLMEGIGKKLNPNMNILDSIRPFTQRIIIERLSPKYLSEKSFKKAIAAVRDLERLPDDFRDIIRKAKNGDLSFNHEINGLNKLSITFNKKINKLMLSIIYLSLNMLGGMIILADINPKFMGLPIWSWFFLVFATVIGVYLVLSLFKGKE